MGTTEAVTVLAGPFILTVQVTWKFRSPLPLPAGDGNVNVMGPWVPAVKLVETTPDSHSLLYSVLQPFQAFLCHHDGHGVIAGEAVLMDGDTEQLDDSQHGDR